ncbi:MAG: PD-(D/E)XK nuclease family protein [Methylophilaceae bacterium]|nr:PD-(D/E)XK nuclease family protein [Methylophilaceae bacterium]
MTTAHLTLTICATARLSRGLQDAHESEQIALGLTQWAAPHIVTLAQWLDEILNEALLLGEIDSFSLPKFVLSNAAENLLWEEVIHSSLQKLAENQSVGTTSLFDIKGLAKSATEANKLIIEWQIYENPIKTNAQSTFAFQSNFNTEETRQFLQWRHAFQRLCSHHHCLEASRYLVLQINSLCKRSPNLATDITLPAHIVFAGYDRFTPLEQQLLDYLISTGISIEYWQPQVNDNQNMQIALEDSTAECRAAVAWAKATLVSNPSAQLAIISPVLGNLRDQLNYLLDDTFHPQTLHPNHYEAPRCYDFSIGLPLTQYSIINSAFNILKHTLPHAKLTQPVCATLLEDTYFSDNRELDNRAILDLKLRRNLGRTFNLEQLIYQANSAQTQGLQIQQLIAHLSQMQLLSDTWTKKQKPSTWCMNFTALLHAVDWSTSRALSSHEYQAQQALLKVFDEFAALDILLGHIAANEAVQRLMQLTHSTMFQPEAKGETHIQLLGLLETVAVQLDAIWIMGMNDQHWPPPAKPNPLLPAQLQRSHGTPSACAEVQANFASIVHQRLSQSAKLVIFSYASKEGDRELRASPTLDKIPKVTTIESVCDLNLKTLTEKLSQEASSSMQYLDDHIAPAVGQDEIARGGSQLLKTQAICPAWAFYQYRLGANSLQEATDGLDSLARGTLVHAALQCFWLNCENLSSLKTMSNQTLAALVAQSVTAGIDQFCEKQGMIMPMQIMALEQYRLEQLLSAWLTLEAERADFSVQACEKELTLNLSGIAVKVVIDRIDVIADGSLVIIDYKTGSQVETKSWADDRISEPQLPMYASIALHQEQIVAVCFGKVKKDSSQFVGIAAQDEILPNVEGLANVRANSAFKKFNDWDSLILHWETSLNLIATEIKNGEAGVKFKDESVLAYCEVKPLLRLPERLLQFEQFQSVTTSPKSINE